MRTFVYSASTVYVKQTKQRLFRSTDRQWPKDLFVEIAFGLHHHLQRVPKKFLTLIGAKKK